MAPRDQADITLEPGLADLHVARRRGEYPAMIDQERLGGVGSDRHLARDRDGRAVEYAAVELDPVGVLGEQPLPRTQLEQSGLGPMELTPAYPRVGAQMGSLELGPGSADQKEWGICLDEARRTGATLALTAVVDQFYADVEAMGGKRWDTSSLVARLTR